MIVIIMKRIVDTIFLNQCSGKEWILSEAIVDLVRIYTYCSGEDANDDLSKHLDTMVEERGNSQDAKHLHSDLFEVHYRMWYRLKDKLINFLEKLLKIPAPTKYHHLLALFLDPRYVMEIKYIKAFHQSENMDSKALSQKMMPKLYA